jgi:hypothetical protein
MTPLPSSSKNIGGPNSAKVITNEIGGSIRISFSIRKQYSSWIYHIMV